MPSKLETVSRITRIRRPLSATVAAAEHGSPRWGLLLIDEARALAMSSTNLANAVTPTAPGEGCRGVGHGWAAKRTTTPKAAGSAGGWANPRSSQA
jgi:hypothetical protein